MSDGRLEDRSDKDVVRACRAGRSESARAFRVLYERYADAAYAFAHQILGDPALAEDALQETFVRLYRKLDRYDPGRPLKPYLLSIAHNVAVDLLRARKPEVFERLSAQQAGAGPVDETAARREVDAAVLAALEAIEPEDRSIILLRHSQRLKLREIAEVLSCTERTVRNRLRAALLQFESALKQRGVVPAEVFP